MRGFANTGAVLKDEVLGTPPSHPIAGAVSSGREKEAKIFL
jgi:hypothetical protein